MQIATNTYCFFLKSPSLFFSHNKPKCFERPSHKTPVFFLKPNSHESKSPRLALSSSIQSETLEILEWTSLCNRLSPFTTTSMGYSASRKATIPIGETIQESQKLLDQTGAALEVILKSGPLDFSGIEDIRAIVDSAVSGTLLTVGELCTVRRTLRAARAVFEKLNEDTDCLERYSPLVEIFEGCDFQVELERKIGFCIDCSLAIILDRASEELELIRSERKKNMENLDNLLKETANQIFQAGGADRPFVTRRRSRFCVGVRASHRYLIPDGVILNVSSSGATYFMEPSGAVELNNLEVQFSNSERAEEITILSLLTSEISESESQIKDLLHRILEIDLASARAAYARSLNAVCPILTIQESKETSSSGKDHALSVDIEAIQHPLLLASSSKELEGNLDEVEEEDGLATARSSSLVASEFPVPINIKVDYRTRVVVISGPNTGGKTASMKTLGIAALMSKAGLYLPAKNTPKLPWFDLVLADIGDHQSLEQNLSTFSGHISRICKILEVTSENSLVLIDEICSGTDPSEGVALSTSILQYLGDRVSLAVVTTHYADLSRLKDNDSRFENAAMEFSLETLKPTYQILWGNTGNSNALTIAKSIGFDTKIIGHAQKWVEKLMPDKQQERKGLLYQSLLEEKNRLEAQAKKAALLNADVMELYHEIQDEAKDLDNREKALFEKESHQVRLELKAAKSQIEAVVRDFDKQVKTTSPDQYNSLIRNSESAIAAIIESHRLSYVPQASRTELSLYTPKSGEQVYVKGLGAKSTTVVEAAEDDETVLVQYGKVRVRVKKSDVRAIPATKRSSATYISQHKKVQGQQYYMELKQDGETSNGPRVQTSKNTVDLRGMRVEEAALHLNMAISSTDSNSVIFVVHGMGTGAVKQCALDILEKHPRVSKHEPESPMNFGCTVAYIK